MFQFDDKEFEILKSQIVISSADLSENRGLGLVLLVLWGYTQVLPIMLDFLRKRLLHYR